MIKHASVIGSIIILLIAWWAIYSDAFSVKPLSYTSTIELSTEPTHVRGSKVVHQAMPSEVRAIYMTACWGGSKKLRSGLIKYIEDTDLNSIIIDIKDYTGTIAVPTTSPLLADGQKGDGCKIPDIKELIEELHNKGIYVIGRVTVFQDPLYAELYPELAVRRVSNKEAVWRDGKGLAFIDVGAQKYWDYIITLAKESHDILGFDEINFDYIRYPSDGNMADTYYAHSGGYRKDVQRADELEKFFIYLHKEMSKPNTYGEVPVTSADIFGMTATNYDDLTIGQVLERTLPYFDVIAPMVYPSHYPSGFLGFKNVNDHSYEIVYHSMKKAVERAQSSTTKIPSFAYIKIEPEPIMQEDGTYSIDLQTDILYKKPVYTGAKLRTWIQDFDYGGDYDVPEINAQIQASRDAGVTGGYMIWSPSNRYTRGVSY